MPLNRVLAFAGVVWFGGMAGFFWSFSVVVMPGLGLAEPGTAMAAMQDINRAVRSPMFAVGFFGAAALAVALGLLALLSRRAPALASGAAACSTWPACSA